MLYIALLHTHTHPAFKLPVFVGDSEDDVRSLYGVADWAFDALKAPEAVGFSLGASSTPLQPLGVPDYGCLA